ncbi:hypothetical protein DEV91_12715 [Phyllobacterium brassicacearum]|nr:hypothetical protein DEV91_12715 [Phyllobacterium brassicacearum]
MTFAWTMSPSARSSNSRLFIIFAFCCGGGPSIPPVEREWFTQKAVADYLGVKVMSVWRYEHGYTDERGKYHPPLEGFPKPSTALGRKLWRKVDLDVFMASRTVA